MLAWLSAFASGDNFWLLIALLWLGVVVMVIKRWA